MARLLAIAAILALAACSDQPPARAPAEPAKVGPAPGPAPSGGLLSGLSASDLETAALGGELGCSFTAADGSTLLVAMGNVASAAPAQGVVKVSGAVRRVTARGGFDAMLRGATFIGEAGTARVALTGPSEVGGESPPRPATLTFAPAGGSGRTVEGQWTCGP